MAKNLMIVESPAKAKTIEKFLGDEFHVTSCFGHIRDLPKGSMAIDVENNFKPTYEISEDKEKITKELKRLAKDSEHIWLATDEDREGEAISWHLCSVLNIDPSEAKRIVFHEITASAIKNAVENPRQINLDLVNAQQARRILDRLVGFELSPILWKKISSKTPLSAGRVQSVAVRMIVEREREITAFESISSYKVSAIFSLQNQGTERETESTGSSEVSFKAELAQRIPSKEEANSFLERCIGAIFSVKDVKVKPGVKSPSAPFTTSTLQQESSRKLGYSLLKTMLLAQRLYEAGKITYMRTDSVNLAESAIEDATKEIKSSYGERYADPHQYKTKSASAQEAHEAIRPTSFAQHEVEGPSDEQRLYDLIWKRAIASQMSKAEIEKTTVTIGISSSPEELTATGQVLKFDGFLKIYMESTDEENGSNGNGQSSTEDESAQSISKETNILPAMATGQHLNLNEMQAAERFSRPPARYTEASLVRKLEELGIGRPSTYAPTISTIQKRGYVEKKTTDGVEREYTVIVLKDGQVVSEKPTEITGAEKSKLFPTDIGSLVNDFLIEHFNKIIDFDFTAKIEKEFDEIAEGNKEWHTMIGTFYEPFHANIEDTLENAARATGERSLGEDPDTGKPVFAKMGRYGAMIQLGDTEGEEKPKFFKLLPHQKLETVTFEEALELFKLPRYIVHFEDKEVVASIGQYGPYLKHDEKFYSLGKDGNIFTVEAEAAIELIKEKRQALKEKTIKLFDEDKSIKVLKGPYGPYVAHGRKYVAVPKDKEPADLTLEECKALIESWKPGRRKGRGGKKKT